MLHLKNNTATINVLIDTGCLQTNIVCARVAALLRQDGKAMKRAGVQLASVEGMMDVTVSLKKLGILRHFFEGFSV